MQHVCISAPQWANIRLMEGLRQNFGTPRGLPKVLVPFVAFVAFVASLAREDDTSIEGELLESVKPVVLIFSAAAPPSLPLGLF